MTASCVQVSAILRLMLVLLWAASASAQTYRVSLDGREHALQDGSRLTGWHPGTSPFRRVPANPVPAAVLPVPPAVTPVPLPPGRMVPLATALNLAAPKVLELFAAYNWNGVLLGQPPQGDPDFANFAAWLSTRCNITDAARHLRIWPYYLDERGKAPAGAADTTTTDAVPIANALARYVWTTRDSIQGRLDWSKIKPSYAGLATVVGTGILYRRTPGGPPMARINTPASVTIGLRPAQGGWFYARESPTTGGWVSVYWIKFP